MDRPLAVERGPEPHHQQRDGHQPWEQVPLGGAERIRPPVQAIGPRSAHEIGELRAVAGDLARGPVAHALPVAEIRERVDRKRHHRGQQHQRPRPDRFHRRAPEPERGHGRERRDQEHPVVDAAEHLRRDQRRDHEAGACRLTLDSTMPREHGERNPERQLHLEVIEVLEAVRRERKDDAGEQASRVRSSDPVYEHVRRQTIQNERGQQKDVVDDQRPRARPLQRGEHDARQQDGVGVRQRPLLRDRRCCR